MRGPVGVIRRLDFRGRPWSCGANSGRRITPIEPRLARPDGLNPPCSESPRSQGLFDHLVGAGEQYRWEYQAKRLGGFKVDNEFKFVGMFVRKIAGFCAETYLIHIVLIEIVHV